MVHLLSELHCKLTSKVVKLSMLSEINYLGINNIMHYRNTTHNTKRRYFVLRITVVL